jgi:hypothetical protein
VIKNPFLGRPEALEQLDVHAHTAGDSEGAPLHRLANASTLVCATPRWHAASDTVKGYFLRSVEASWGPRGLLIVRPICVWDELIEQKRPRRSKKEQERRFQAVIAGQEKEEKWRKHFAAWKEPKVRKR